MLVVTKIRFAFYRSSKTLTEKVNRDLKRHSRKVYSSQLCDHIVEQIDLAYYQAGSPNLDDETEVEDADTLYQGDNLTLDE
jgi:hypothetical protein